MLSWHSFLPLLGPIALLPLRGPDALLVPAQFPTIQAAVDASVDGDTIAISSGTYAESVVVSGRSNLVLLGKGKVVIDPPGDVVGLTLEGCTNSSVKGIRVTGASVGILLTGCTGGGVVKCRVESVSDAGISIDGSSGVTVEQCTIIDTERDGIILGATESTPSNDCFVRKNKIHRAGDEGIDVSGNGNAVEGNQVRDAVSDAFRTEFEPLATANTFHKNKAMMPGGAGFRVHGTSNVLTDNHVVKCVDHAVRLQQGSGHVVQRLKSLASGRDGAFCHPSVTGVTITGCTITKPTQKGIDIEGARSTVSGNRITKPGLAGCEIEGDEATVDSNKVSAAGEDGFHVWGSGGTYTKNTASACAGDGFELAGAGNTLSLNRAKGSKGGFDLNDESGGANAVDGSNQFKTTSP